MAFGETRAAGDRMENVTGKDLLDALGDSKADCEMCGSTAKCVVRWGTNSYQSALLCDDCTIKMHRWVGPDLGAGIGVWSQTPVPRETRVVG